MTRMDTNKFVMICAICGEKLSGPLRLCVNKKPLADAMYCVPTLNGNTGNDDEYMG